MKRLFLNRKNLVRISGFLLLVACVAAGLTAISLPLGMPQAEAKKKPFNIVLLLTDDQTMESLSKMPYVSSRPGWVTFDNAFINTSLCCPSRASILSGEYSHHDGVQDNNGGHFIDEDHLLPTWLATAGYRSALIGKYLNKYPFRRPDYTPPGWDDWHAFLDHPSYFGYTLIENGAEVDYGKADADYSTDALASKAIQFIQNTDSPFFLYWAPYAPHELFTPAHRYAKAYPAKSTVIVNTPNFNEADVSDKPAWVQQLPLQDPNDMNNQRLRGWRTLLAVDDAVKGIFDALAAKGVLNNTVVVFMTDNGLSLGAHRWATKRCVYEECVRTPLLVWYPGAVAHHVPQLVSNVDIASTFAEIAGVTPTLPQDGMSLVPFLKGNTPANWRTGVLLEWEGGNATGDDETAPTAIPGFWAIRTDRYKYVELDTGETELYDLQTDPYELANQTNNPALAALKANLVQQLAALKPPTP
jgi:arylsulfatase A-like enzyme